MKRKNVQTSAELDNEVEEEEKKRKAKRPSSEDGVVRPLELSRGELYKAPTLEELSRLKEAESLFHCSLLKMQMEELLKEVALSERRKRLADSFVQRVTELLHAVPETPVTEVSDLSWLSVVRVPFLLVPNTTKGKFHMKPPASVSLVGSYPLGTCIKPHVSVDLMVTIPASVLHPMDAINQRYPRKRALYLAGLTEHLLTSPAVGKVQYSCLHGNRLRPILLVTPPGKDAGSLTLRIHPCPPPDFLKPSRFHPQKNNVRTDWFTGLEASQPESKEPATPQYNCSVVGDHLPQAHLQYLTAFSEQCPAFKDGVALLKVWLRQRELDQGTGCFGGFLASMLLAHLLSTHKVNRSMTAYQLLRNSLHFLASTDLTENGITLARNPDSKAPSMADFHSMFPVVFVDHSGHLNLCAEMTAFTYKRIQHEALLSVKVWDDPTVDGFQALLMTPKPLIRTYDHVFQLCELGKLQLSCKKLGLMSELMDHSGNYVLAALPFILSLLQRGLGQRVQLLAHSLPLSPEWPVDQAPPKHMNQPPLSFGLLLQPEHATSVLERGPPADSPKAAEFRELWGPLSELRRFQDGGITEAVLWSATSTCQKRLVPQQIITHLLQLHASVPASSVRYVGGQLDSVINLGQELCSTGEEESLRVIQNYDDLSRKLWQLEDLPLSITSVQGAHPALRYTQVIPPVPVRVDYACFIKEKPSHALLPQEDKPCPVYICPIKVICHLEGSGKWPHDHLAIRHVKAAFHIRLGELLHAEHRYTCRPSATHLDVWKDGLVFRIELAYHREPLVLRELISPEGLQQQRDNAEARALELEIQHKPLLTSTLHGLQQQQPCFGTACRLAKRWLAAQLFSADLSEEAADLLVASLFLQPAPFTSPCSPQVGFLRFLHLLSTFDWKNSPLVVNLNNQLSAAEYTEIKNNFVSTRQSLPVMFIATPTDRKLSMWTQESPSVQMLQRMVMVASESLRVLEAQLMDLKQLQDVRVVFRPPLDVYDVLIHLKIQQVPLVSYAVDRPKKFLRQGTNRGPVADPGGFLPVIDYNPVSKYLKELRDSFGDIALFFYDVYGGKVITVLWKPQAFEPQPFKTSLMNARCVKVTDENVCTVPNVDAILQDFCILGEGLVQNVEPRTKTWTV